MYDDSFSTFLVTICTMYIHPVPHQHNKILIVYLKSRKQKTFVRFAIKRAFFPCCRMCNSASASVLALSNSSVETSTKQFEILKFSSASISYFYQLNDIYKMTNAQLKILTSGRSGGGRSFVEGIPFSFGISWFSLGAVVRIFALDVLGILDSISILF